MEIESVPLQDKLSKLVILSWYRLGTRIIGEKNKMKQIEEKMQKGAGIGLYESTIQALWLSELWDIFHDYSKVIVRVEIPLGKRSDIALMRSTTEKRLCVCELKVENISSHAEGRIQQDLSTKAKDYSKHDMFDKRSGILVFASLALTKGRIPKQPIWNNQSIHARTIFLFGGPIFPDHWGWWDSNNRCVKCNNNLIQQINEFGTNKKYCGGCSE